MLKRNKRLIGIGVIAALVAIGIFAMRDVSPVKEGSYYTCPMHPQIRADAPGACPICGMDLVKVEEPAAPHNHGMPSTPSPGAGITIDPVYTQRIGVKTAPVEMRDVGSKKGGAGKGVSDPIRAVTETEYREAVRLNDTALIEAAQQKLRLLGLSAEEIADVKKEPSLPGMRREKRLTILRSAILFNGDHTMVYVKEGDRYLPRKIEIGEKFGDAVEVLEGLKEGENVVTNGHFLIDSETQIKMGGMSGAHQH